MKFPIQVLWFSVSLTCFVQNSVVGQLNNGHFSSWENVPDIIESVTKTNYHDQFEQLHELTWIKLGSPHMSDFSKEEQQRHVLQTKERWTQWWASTGEPTLDRKKQDAEIDRAAFQLALNFIGVENEKPKEIPIELEC